MISIYDRLRAEGYSAERAAKLSGVPVTTLRRQFGGEFLTPWVLWRVSEACELDPAPLLGLKRNSLKTLDEVIKAVDEYNNERGLGQREERNNMVVRVRDVEDIERIENALTKYRMIKDADVTLSDFFAEAASFMSNQLFSEGE
jgi:hypothetical protein